MKLVSITTKDKFKKLIDSSGYFKRFLELKRLEKYANEIDMVLTKYNKKSCDETMMVKGLRKSCAETTNRKIHQEDLEKIVKQIAKELGLNEQIVGIMGKHHDIGHTFSGHSGEWWISSVQEDIGIGYLCHNTLGARELIYTNQIYDEIINKIKVHNPKVSSKELAKIRKSLWLIIDGINTHNGEKPEKEYIPDIQKTQQGFEEEMLNCYVKKGFDREVVPATPEACLMRLADQISYIPLDMMDGLREGIIRDKKGNIVSTLDEDYIDVLTKLGIELEEIKEANFKHEYGKIAERLKEIFINDVIKNSTKKKITMSKEVMQLMNALRNLNNEKAVNNVILIEDQQTYPAAIRKLMERFSDIILQNGIIEQLEKQLNHEEISKGVDKFAGTPDKGFVKYTYNTNSIDFEFTKKIVEEATKQSIRDELEIARQCAQKQEVYQEHTEPGISYEQKHARIKSYVLYYQSMLNKGKLIGYTDEDREQEVENIMKHIKGTKQNPNHLNMKQRIAMALAAKYISTLNDTEFIRVLQSTEIITPEQYESLTQKYVDIKDLKSKVHIQTIWKVLQKEQKKAAEEISK